MMRCIYFGICCALAISMVSCDGCDDEVDATTEDDESTTEEASSSEEDSSPSVAPRVAVGNGWACFIDDEGSLDCDGELSEEFASPPEGRFRRISVGSTHACALDVDGHSHCWNRDGELGVTRTPEGFAEATVADLAVPPAEGVFRDVAVADDITCAALDEGGVQCWGQGSDWHEWDAIEETFDEVVATSRHVCAIDIDGDVQCWTGASGASGEPMERLREYGPFAGIDKANHDPDLFGAAVTAGGDIRHWPVEAMPSGLDLDSLPLREGDYRQVVVGHHFQCALDAEGAVECYKCVVVDGGSDASCEPEVENYLDDSPAGPFEYLSAGWGDVCAVDADAEVVCWGTSTEGEPGTPSDLRVLDPRADGVVAPIEIEDIGIADALSDDVIGEGPLDELFDDEGEFEEMAAFVGDGDELKIGRGSGGMGLRRVGDDGDEGAGRIGGLGEVDTGGGAVGDGADRDIEPRMELGSPSVGDFCDVESIRQSLDARSNALLHCYERELPTNPELSGDVTVNGLIELDGSVSNVMISDSTLNHPKVEQCIIGQIERMRLAEPDGGMCDVDFPFEFSVVE